MKYGNYILREGYEPKLAKIELQSIKDKIIVAAKAGNTKVNCWIKFQSTYDALVLEGYILSGGRIKEAVPQKLVDKWGKIEDQFLIEWTVDSLLNINTEDRISPILKSPDKEYDPNEHIIIIQPDTSIIPDLQEREPEGQENVSENVPELEPKPAIFNIMYKVLENNADLFAEKGEYASCKMSGGIYPINYKEGEDVDISNLRYYFCGESHVIYKFYGWYLNGKRKRKIDGHISTPTGDIVLYADIRRIPSQKNRTE